MKEVKELILFFLLNSASYSHPLTSPQLIERLRGRGHIVTDPQIRTCIKELAQESEHLVSSCENGFYIAHTAEEYEAAIAWIGYRIRPLVERQEMMKKKLIEKFYNNQPSLFV